jgi:small multidrug resistance pump
MNTAYLYLGLAIVLEVAGTICMKLSHGFTKWIPTTFTAIFYVLCFSLFAIALKKIEVGTAYAIWAGMGTALIAVAGVLFFKESITAPKVISLTLIIVGVVGLNLVRGEH